MAETKRTKNRGRGSGITDRLERKVKREPTDVGYYEGCRNWLAPSGRKGGRGWSEGVALG